MNGSRPTLQDISDSLGVSVNTVSRALSGKPGVGPATRERIQAEAERIGYVPNAHARSLVLGARMLIGLVITNASNPFYAGLISQIEKSAAEAGYSLILLSSDESPEQEEDAAGALLRSGVDGAIVVPVQHKRNPWNRLQRTGLPIVLVNRAVSALEADLVGTDNRAGMEATAAHVIEQGATSFLMFEEDLDIDTIHARVQGLRDAAESAGLPWTDDAVVRVPSRRSGSAILPWHADEAYRITLDLLDRGRQPDAILTGNDYFALGALRAFHERGISVPSDVIVTGYGDYPFSSHLSPSLTTARLPMAEIGKQAVNLILRRISGDGPQTLEQHTFSPEIVVRESSRRSPTAFFPRNALSPTAFTNRTS